MEKLSVKRYLKGRRPPSAFENSLFHWFADGHRFADGDVGAPG